MSVFLAGAHLIEGPLLCFTVFVLLIQQRTGPAVAAADVHIPHFCLECTRTLAGSFAVGVSFE